MNLDPATLRWFAEYLDHYHAEHTIYGDWFGGISDAASLARSAAARVESEIDD